MTTYSSWAYTASGVKHSFTGTDFVEVKSSYILNPKLPPVPCGISLTTSLDVGSTDGFYYLQATGGAGSASSITPGIVYPKYQVESILYATPGNFSNNGFTNSTTDGVTTTVGNSFAAGDTTTFSVSGGFLGLGSTLSWSYGWTATTGNSTASTATITDATGILNASNSQGSNTINHQQDLFVIWLNPAVYIYQAGPSSVTSLMGTQLQTAGDPSPGQPEQYQDQVEVYAQAMLASSGNNNLTTVPVEILVPQVVGSETLPGLANICANPIYYPNSCTLANQCGCVPSDFAPILAQDPLLNYTSTESPLNADTSGTTVCAKPATSSSCRYVPVPTAPGSTVQEVELLSGPDEQGGNRPINTFTQTDSTQVTQTLSESLANSVGFSWEQDWKFIGTGISLKNAEQFTWTSSESTGAINGSANSQTVTLSSGTVGCYQDVPIFEDTVFHTFVFQQPAGNTSCP
jgi:hypothetical protein